MLQSKTNNTKLVFKRPTKLKQKNSNHKLQS